MLKKDSYQRLSSKESKVEHLLFEHSPSECEGGFSISTAGVTLPEDDDKCCFALPIELGVKLIGAIIIIQGVMAVLAILPLFAVNLEALLLIACYVPLIPAALLFLNWFMGDTKEKREKLSMACKLVILSQLCLVAWAVCTIVIWGGVFSAVSRFVINGGITAVCYLYFATVCDRYVDK